jgi:hypothetical protein
VVLGSPKPFPDRKRAFWRIGVLSNQRSKPTRGKPESRQANAARSADLRADHSGVSPHKAHVPGVKKILQEIDLEIVLLVRRYTCGLLMMLGAA